MNGWVRVDDKHKREGGKEESNVGDVWGDMRPALKPRVSSGVQGQEKKRGQKG